MSPILRTATTAAVSLCALAVAAQAMPSFATSVEPLPAPPALTALPEAMTVDTPLDAGTPETDPAPVPAKFASLSAMVAAEETAGKLSAEQECLAGAIYFESRSESLEGQLAVAEVIRNRAESGRFPGSLCGVVHQRGQFSFVRGGRMPAIDRGSRDWREAVAIARISENDRWESAAPDALFFHATRVSPRWKLRRVATVGNHVFYR
jgi:N-acetylmuramoyl-L-alanine amidase